MIKFETFLTYLECIDKFFKIDFTISILIEVFEHLSALIFGHLNTEVHETPPKVVNIEVAVTLDVHSLEYSLEASDTEGRSVQDFGAKLFHKVPNVKF